MDDEDPHNSTRQTHNGEATATTNNPRHLSESGSVFLDDFSSFQFSHQPYDNTTFGPLHAPLNLGAFDIADYNQVPNPDLYLLQPSQISHQDFTGNRESRQYTLNPDQSPTSIHGLHISPNLDHFPTQPTSQVAGFEAGYQQQLSLLSSTSDISNASNREFEYSRNEQVTTYLFNPQSAMLFNHTAGNPFPMGDFMAPSQTFTRPLDEDLIPPAIYSGDLVQQNQAMFPDLTLWPTATETELNEFLESFATGSQCSSGQIIYTAPSSNEAYSTFGGSPPSSTPEGPRSTAHPSFRGNLVLRPQTPNKLHHTQISYNQRASSRQPCPKCWAQKKKCKVDMALFSPFCSNWKSTYTTLPFCGTNRPTYWKPFAKWKNEIYEELFTMVRSNYAEGNKIVQLHHYSSGPTIGIICCKFLPTEPFQTRVLRKDASGWHWVGTTAYCLAESKLDLTPYIRECVPNALEEACNRPGPPAFFFRLARSFKNVPIIQQCLELFTTLELMRIGWHFAGTESLGMSVVDNTSSPWHGIKPVPRMLQNQLNHQLELKMAEIDERIVKSAMAIMKNADRKQWLVGTLSLFLLLHVREIDAGRNFFWNRYEDKDGFWIHPSKPCALIAEAIASSNCLLTHFHCTIGRKPLEKNWDSAKSKELVGNDEKLVEAMKALQLHVVSLDEEKLIGRKACDVYRDGDAHSVAFTISSLLFPKSTTACEVSGFH